MSDNDITVVIDGDEIKKFLKVSISKSLDSVSRGFLFSISQDQFDAKIEMNATVQIYVNTYLEVTGKINKIVPSYDVDNHNIDVSGFSDTYDLVRGTIFTNPNYATPISFLDLAEKVLEDNGIQGIQISPTIAANEVVSVIDDDENRTAGDIGETIFSFLDRYAKKVGVILSDDPSGKLVVYKNKPNASDIRIRNRRDFFNNKLILAASYDVDYSKRFQKVIVKSQDENEDSIEAFALDNDVKAQGVMTIISENLSDIAGCQTQANFEVNKRRADSVKYNCKTFGFGLRKSGNWEINTAVDVADDFAGIKSKMMIRAVQFNFSENQGSTTNLSMTIPYAFGQKISDEDRYNAIFGESDLLQRHDELFGTD